MNWLDSLVMVMAEGVVPEPERVKALLGMEMPATVPALAQI